jgi:hypothetical protein
MRDRIMTLAKNGRWTGGRIPLGYDRVDRRLVVNPAEAEIIRFVFERFVEVRSCRIVAEELQRKGCLTKTWVNDQGVRFGGTPIVSTSVYNFLGNRLYVGEITHKGEAYPGIHEAIVSRELWEAAQTVRSGLGKVRQANPAKKTLLAGLLFDGFGRRMISHSPARHGRIYRYYISAQTREGARQLHRTLRVDAAVLEAMVRTGICVFLRDRFELGGALLKRGQHDADLEALVDSGMAAARHLEALEPARLRLIYEVLIRRVEITRDKVRVILGCEEILLLLAWDGIGILRLPAGAVKADPHIHAVEFEAESVRTERAFTMPVEPRAPGLAYSPNPRLVALLKMARKVQAAIQAERHLSIAEIAVRFEKQPGYVARVLRLNYLAPDIQTAILDGLQPPELNSRRLLFGHIPMEWREQRTMLGFPPRDEVLRGLGNYRRPYRSERVEDAGADQGE